MQHIKDVPSSVVQSASHAGRDIYNIIIRWLRDATCSLLSLFQTSPHKLTQRHLLLCFLSHGAWNTMIGAFYARNQASPVQYSHLFTSYTQWVSRGYLVQIRLAVQKPLAGL